MVPFLEKLGLSTDQPMHRTVTNEGIVGLRTKDSVTEEGKHLPS